MSELDSARERLELMNRTRSVTIVGMSARPERASYFVATYLKAKTDWSVWYVNPVEAERNTTILDQPVFASLSELPEPVDLVDVFRRSDDLPGVVEEAIAAEANAVWFQLGLRNDEAAQTASDAGLDVVQDRCLKIEHARFAGGLSSAGFVTDVIDSRRQRLI